MSAFVVTSYLETEVDYVPVARAITQDPRFSRYHLAKVFSTEGRRYHELLFLRDDEPLKGAP